MIKIKKVFKLVDFIPFLLSLPLFAIGIGWIINELISLEFSLYSLLKSAVLYVSTGAFIFMPLLFIWVTQLLIFQKVRFISIEEDHLYIRTYKFNPLFSLSEYNLPKHLLTYQIADNEDQIFLEYTVSYTRKIFTIPRDEDNWLTIIKELEKFDFKNESLLK